MSTTALTVQSQRHLQLPDSCLFAPTELSIPTELSQSDFSRLGKALASVDQASDLWACDYALAGQKRWSDEGLKLASKATRLSVGYLKVGARIAERFDPSRRFPNLTRNHYRGLCCFPVEFTDAWLPTVVEKGFGAKTLRALAVEAYGSDPKEGYTRKQNKKLSVSIPVTMYSQFQERSPIPKVAVFIEQILEDWLSSATTEQQSRVAAALLTREEANHQRRRAGRNRVKAEKLAAREKREAEKVKDAGAETVGAQKDAQGSSRNEGKSPDDAQPRPEKGAEAETPKRTFRAPEQRKKCRCKIRLVWSSCHGLGANKNLRSDSFADREAAEAAQRQYESCHKYPPFISYCEKCHAFHLYHFEQAARSESSIHIPTQTL